MPFDDDDNDNNVKVPNRKIGIKNTNVSHKEKSSSKQVFENLAEEKFSQIEEYKQKMWDLSVKYKSLIQNKVLPENKGPILANLEKEILDELIKLASVMNEDETQPEGIGNTALCMLLMKCMLLQRDETNIISAKLDDLLKNKNQK